MIDRICTRRDIPPREHPLWRKLYVPPPTWPATEWSGRRPTVCCPIHHSHRNVPARPSTDMGSPCCWTGCQDQSGWTWHKRWQASGVEQAGAAWRPVIGQWLRERGLHTAWRIRALGPALGTVISADLLRPSMDWLAVMPTNGRGWPAAWRASVMLKALRGWKNRANRLRASEYFAQVARQSVDRRQPYRKLSP